MFDNMNINENKKAKKQFTKKHENCLQHEHVNAKLMKTEIQIRKMKTEIQMKKKKGKNDKHNERTQELSQTWKNLIFLETCSFSCHVFFIETHIEFWSSLIMRLCILKLFLAVLSKLFFLDLLQDDSKMALLFCAGSLALFRIATQSVANFLGRLSITGRWCMRPAPVTVLVSMVVIRVLWQATNHRHGGRV